jgi:hypothetical protein
MIFHRSSILILKVTTIVAVIVFSVGLPHAKSQTRGRPQSPAPQVPASSICTGTVAGVWAPTDRSVGPLTITRRDDLVHGVYIFRGQPRTLDGRVSGDSVSGTWTEDATVTSRGNKGDFTAKFDSRQHILEGCFELAELSRTDQHGYVRQILASRRHRHRRPVDHPVRRLELSLLSHSFPTVNPKITIPTTSGPSTRYQKKNRSSL